MKENQAIPNTAFFLTQFQIIHKMFEDMGKRFEGVEERLNKIELRLGNQESAIAYLRKDIKGLAQILSETQELVVYKEEMKTFSQMNELKYIF